MSLKPWKWNCYCNSRVRRKCCSTECHLTSISPNFHQWRKFLNIFNNSSDSAKTFGEDDSSKLQLLPINSFSLESLTEFRWCTTKEDRVINHLYKSVLTNFLRPQSPRTAVLFDKISLLLAYTNSYTSFATSKYLLDIAYESKGNVLWIKQSFTRNKSTEICFEK